jgi:hypothetical protein
MSESDGQKVLHLFPLAEEVADAVREMQTQGFNLPNKAEDVPVTKEKILEMEAKAKNMANLASSLKNIVGAYKAIHKERTK